MRGLLLAHELAFRPREPRRAAPRLGLVHQSRARQWQRRRGGDCFALVGGIRGAAPAVGACVVVAVAVAVVGVVIVFAVLVAGPAPCPLGPGGALPTRGVGAARRRGRAGWGGLRGGGLGAPRDPGANLHSPLAVGQARASVNPRACKFQVRGVTRGRSIPSAQAQACGCVLRRGPVRLGSAACFCAVLPRLATPLLPSSSCYTSRCRSSAREPRSGGTTRPQAAATAADRAGLTTRARTRPAAVAEARCARGVLV